MDLITRTKQLGAKEGEKNYMRAGVRKPLRTGLVPVRAWRGQAVGICAYRKRRRQMTAAAGKKDSVSVSLFMEVNESGKLRKNFPPWPRLLGRKVSGWEDGEESSRRLGGSRSSRCKRGDR